MKTYNEYLAEKYILKKRIEERQSKLDKLIEAFEK